MANFQIALPIVLYMVKVLDDNQQTFNSYLFKLLHTIGIIAPKRLLISILIQPIIGIVIPGTPYLTFLGSNIEIPGNCRISLSKVPPEFQNTTMIFNT